MILFNNPKLNKAGFKIFFEQKESHNHQSILPEDSSWTIMKPNILLKP